MNNSDRLRQALSFLKSKRERKSSRNNRSKSFFIRPTTTEEVVKIINNFQNKNSTGIDGISAKVLKTLPIALVNCLVHVFI